MSNKNYNIYIPKHKHNNLNHERNMTNFQLNNINYLIFIIKYPF